MAGAVNGASDVRAGGVRGGGDAVASGAAGATPLSHKWTRRIRAALRLLGAGSRWSPRSPSAYRWLVGVTTDVLDAPAARRRVRALREVRPLLFGRGCDTSCPTDRNDLSGGPPRARRTRGRLRRHRPGRSNEPQLLRKDAEQSDLDQLLHRETRGFRQPLSGHQGFLTEPDRVPWLLPTLTRHSSALPHTQHATRHSSRRERHPCPYT